MKEEKTAEVPTIPIETRLKDIAKAIHECRETPTATLPPTVIKDLFEIAPDLECIQKDARPRVRFLP